MTRSPDILLIAADRHRRDCFGVGLQLRTVRTADAKLTVDLLSGAGEMDDLANDPDEMDNPFDGAAGQGLRREPTDMIRARPGPVLSEFPEHRE